LNLRDNGISVIVGQNPQGRSWNKAIDDGWVPGKTLFRWKKLLPEAPSFNFWSPTPLKWPPGPGSGLA